MSHDDTKAVILRRNPRNRRSRDGLIRYAKDYTSQNGEDGVLERLFDLLNLTKGWCIDVGAWDGQHLSNTYTLLVKREWKGILLEAVAERCNELRALHEPLGNVVIEGAVSCNPQSSNHILQLLESAKAPSRIDFLCIDVDGIDYWLHDFLKSSYELYVVCIEYNPTMPQDLIYIPPRSDQQRHGCSLAALVELMEAHDFILVETTLYNAFFVPTQVYQEHLSQDIPDTSIEALNEVTMGTSLYQLNDGTIKLHGCKKLLWHRIPMDEHKMQLLSEEDREFPFQPDKNASQLDAVDLSLYCKPSSSTNPTRCENTLKHLWQQLSNDGFCFVTGTGISAQDCTAALDWTRDFLHDAPEAVRKSALSKTDRARRGYAPMGTENFASLLGKHGRNDLVRKFRMGPTSKQEGSLFAPNIWPSDWKPEFQPKMEEFYEKFQEAAQHVLEAIIDAVQFEHPALISSLASLAQSGETHATSHSSILTLLGYRLGSRHKRSPPTPLVAAHTDVGVLTMLVFDTGGCAKLQRQVKSDVSSWIDIELPPLKPTTEPVFVVNIGDCLSELTQRVLPSTIHRVFPTKLTKPRSCLAMFLGLHPQQKLCFGEETITYEEWRRRRVARAQAALNVSTTDASD